MNFEGTALDFGFGGRYLVPPGNYDLRVEADGFAPARQPVDGRQPCPASAIVVALERLPGRVAFDTGGVAATLAVDGAHGRRAAGRIRAAAPARASSPSTAPHFAEERLRFEVTGGGERQSLKVTPEAASSRASP